MNCTECQEIVQSYLGDDLERSLLADIESHLASCSDCRHETADWQDCINRLRETFPEQLPPAELWAKIQGKVGG